MNLILAEAEPGDAVEIAELRNAAADDLTRRFGKGHWSGHGTERGVRYDMRRSRVFVARESSAILGSLVLGTRKPWAIDVTYFSRCRQPLYLTAMVVHPGSQRQGIGRRCLELLPPIVRGWPADALRLDAYDAEAGAGPFYARCGFREVGRVAYKGSPLIYFEQLLPG